MNRVGQTYVRLPISAIVFKQTMEKRVFWSYCILWVLLNTASLYIQTKQTYEFASELAFDQGKMFFDHIVSMRSWNASHGGVYVPITESTRPNSYLKTPYRDITRPDGQQFTLINPAFMTRQLSEIDHEKTGILFHLTSLNPIRPENKADQWETSSLQLFESGKKNINETSLINGKLFYRYMEPLFVKKACLQCHEQQGYKEGDIRGGISVSIPAKKVTKIIEKRIESIVVIHIVIFSTGLVLIFVFQLARKKITKKLKQAKNQAHLAYIDPLTSLPNRRQYEIFFKKEWRLAFRHEYPLSMIMIDIDNFKEYNDTLGHPEGDKCLKKVATILKKQLKRAEDLVARYGGEEFCVVASCDSKQINLLAKNIRKSIEESQISHPTSKVSSVVTISLGVATLFPDKKNRPKHLLQYADEALYLAKENGRNRVEIYSENLNK